MASYGIDVAEFNRSMESVQGRKQSQREQCCHRCISKGAGVWLHDTVQLTNALPHYRQEVLCALLHLPVLKGYHMIRAIFCYIVGQSSAKTLHVPSLINELHHYGDIKGVNERRGNCNWCLSVIFERAWRSFLKRLLTFFSMSRHVLVHVQLLLQHHLPLVHLLDIIFFCQTFEICLSGSTFPIRISS